MYLIIKNLEIKIYVL